MKDISWPGVTSGSGKKHPISHFIEWKMVYWLVVEPTHLKNMFVKLDPFLQGSG